MALQDLEYAGKLGIYVNNVPDYGVEEVADTALSHILNLFRKTPEMVKCMREGKVWHTPIAKELKAERIRGKVLGIIGFGKIGKAAAQRAKAFGLEVVFYDPYVEDGLDKVFQVTRTDTLKGLMSQADVISYVGPAVTRTTDQPWY
jgi:lactate dehydrogenase-like 2-hydroxyacid dehydrogenase